jgi:hypothetical protein
MNTLLASKWLRIAPLLLCIGCGGAFEDEDPPATPPTPPPAPAVDPAPAPEPYAEAAPPAAIDASPQLVYTYPSGQWVFMSGRGWVWIPNGTTSADVEGVPYTYLYTPAYGWTWYVSPWGWGPYRYGVWTHHPWHPVGWHGHWVAHPHVVVRLGRGGYHRWR